MKHFTAVRNVSDLDPGVVDVLNRNFKQLAVEDEIDSTTVNYSLATHPAVCSLQADATAGAIIVILPSPTGNRRRRIVKNDASANTVTVSVSTVGQLINDATSVVLTYRYEFIEVEPTGTTWLVVARGTLFPSANGIVFPATQVPSADPNTLDDYEEGTWTPSVGGSATYTTQVGTYTKIGRQVHVHCRLTINAIGTGSTSTITGLPFTALNLSGGNVSYWATLALNPVFLSCYATGTGVHLVGATAAAGTLTDNIAVLQSGSDVLISLTYFV